MRIIRYLMIFVFIFASCYCSKKKEDHTLKRKIYFSHYFSFEGNSKVAMDGVIDSFNKMNPRYEIIGNAIDHESFKTGIKEDMKSDSPVEMYSIWAGERTLSIVDKLEPIDDEWKKYNMDLIFPAALSRSACVYGGKKYLLPITQHVVLFFYNKKVFNSLNLKEPKTWEEFLEVCRVLKSKNIIPLALGSKSRWPSQFWFDYILLRTAGNDYRQKLVNGNASYLDREVIGAFEIWKKLVDSKYFNERPSDMEWDIGATDMVVKGKAGMTLMGSWIIGYLSSNAVNWKEVVDYDVFQFPVIDGNVELTSLGPVDGIVVAKKSKNIDGASEALAYFAKEESQKMISKWTGCISPNRKVPDEFYSSLQRKFIGIIADSKNWAFNYDLAVPNEVAELGLNSFDEFLEYPDLYLKILENLDKESRKLYGTTPGEKY